MVGRARGLIPVCRMHLTWELGQVRGPSAQVRICTELTRHYRYLGHVRNRYRRLAPDSQGTPLTCRQVISQRSFPTPKSSVQRSHPSNPSGSHQTADCQYLPGPCTPPLEMVNLKDLPYQLENSQIITNHSPSLARSKTAPNHGPSPSTTSTTSTCAGLSEA